MNNLDLIQHLTWAIVEVTTVDRKPNLAGVAAALEAALHQALLAQEKEMQLKTAIVRTATVCDAPIVTDGKIHEGGSL